MSAVGLRDQRHDRVTNAQLYCTSPALQSPTRPANLADLRPQWPQWPQNVRVVILEGFRLPRRRSLVLPGLLLVQPLAKPLAQRGRHLGRNLERLAVLTEEERLIVGVALTRKPLEQLRVVNHEDIAFVMREARARVVRSYRETSGAVGEGRARETVDLNQVVSFLENSSRTAMRPGERLWMTGASCAPLTASLSGLRSATGAA